MGAIYRGLVTNIFEHISRNAHNEYETNQKLPEYIERIKKDKSKYRVRQNYVNQGLMERYKFNSLSAINLTRG